MARYDTVSRYPHQEYFIEELRQSVTDKLISKLLYYKKNCREKLHSEDTYTRAVHLISREAQ